MWLALLVHGQLPVSIWNACGKLEFMTPSAASLLRSLPEQLQGRLAQDIFPAPAGRERQQMIAEIAATGKPTLVIESIGGAPVYSVFSRLARADRGGGSGGQRQAVVESSESESQGAGGHLVLSVNHIGHAAATFRVDPAVYDIYDPSMSALASPDRLTDRELEVLRYLAQGMNHKQIAKLIHRSLKTVEWHRAQLGRKLNVTTRAELVHFAFRHGLISESGTEVKAAAEGVSTVAAAK